MGNGFYLVGQPSVADRGFSSIADAGRSAKAVRLQTPDRSGERKDLRIEFSSRVRHRCQSEAEGHTVGLCNEAKGKVSCRGCEALEYSIWVDKGVKRNQNVFFA